MDEGEVIALEVLNDVPGVSQEENVADSLRVCVEVCDVVFFDEGEHFVFGFFGGYDEGVIDENFLNFFVFFDDLFEDLSVEIDGVGEIIRGVQGVRFGVEERADPEVNIVFINRHFGFYSNNSGQKVMYFVLHERFYFWLMVKLCTIFY